MQFCNKAGEFKMENMGKEYLSLPSTPPARGGGRVPDIGVDFTVLEGILAPKAIGPKSVL